MKYLIFTEEPQQTPKIGDGSFLKATKCQEGWFVLTEHKIICNENGMTNYTEADNFTPINQVI